jgi:hypothetical protein
MGPNPIPTSFILPFMISRSKGAYGTTLSAQLPQVAAKWGYVTGISLNLGRSFSFHGKEHEAPPLLSSGRACDHRKSRDRTSASGGCKQSSYLSAGCPAPKGVSIVSFPFARASFGFAGGQTIRSTLTRSCRATG